MSGVPGPPEGDRPGRILVIGIGPGGPDQLTVEAVRALNQVSAHLVVSKREGDPLAAARQAIIARHVSQPVPLIEVTDPERDRGDHPDQASYRAAVADWHAARVRAYREAIAKVTGEVGLLVWGDPGFYDSTIRIVEQLGRPFSVIPGVSSVSLLAARFGIVLHEIGQPVHLTTGRRMASDLAAGQSNLIGFLLTQADLDALAGDLQVWWGANLGTADESLVQGRWSAIAEQVARERVRVRQAAGWVMDLVLVRR